MHFNWCKILNPWSGIFTSLYLRGQYILVSELILDAQCHITQLKVHKQESLSRVPHTLPQLHIRIMKSSTTHCLKFAQELLTRTSHTLLQGHVRIVKSSITHCLRFIIQESLSQIFVCQDLNSVLAGGLNWYCYRLLNEE